MRNVLKGGSMRLVVALILLVGVGVVTGIAINIDNGSGSGEFSNVGSGGNEVSVRNDGDKGKAEASHAEPKGVTESSADENDVVGQGSSNYQNVVSGKRVSASTSSAVVNNDVTVSNDTVVSDDASLNGSSNTSSEMTETDAERAAREEAERAAAMAEAMGNPSVWNPMSEVKNTYYWQNKCPERVVPETSIYEGKLLGGYICESTSYVAWKAYKAYDGVVINWGNANLWDSVAAMLNYEVSRTPQIGAIGQTKSGAYGHVFWVENVYSDGSILVTEYNNSWATYVYSGDMHANDFGARVISASEAAQYNYIILGS